MKTLTIRTANSSDIPELVLIEQENHARWSKETFTNELSIPHSHTYIAEKNKQIAGFLTIWTIAQEIEIQNIVIARKYQHQGIGTFLMTYLNDMSLKMNISCIYLEVREKNLATRAFYKKTGFTESGIRKNYYQDDNAVLMIKKIKEQA